MGGGAVSTERKEWVKVSRAANGKVTVTVSLVEENLSSKASVIAMGLPSSKPIKTAVGQARALAVANLDEIREALT